MHEMFVDGVEDVVQREDVQEGGEVRSPGTTFFKLEMKAFHHVQAPGVFYSDRLGKSFYFIFVAERAPHFWRHGLPATVRLGCVDYMGFRNAASMYLSFTSFY